MVDPDCDERRAEADLAREERVAHLGRELAAMDDGRVSGVQAGVICEAIDKLPTSPVLRAEAEACLLDDATRLDATQLAEAGRRRHRRCTRRRLRRLLRERLPTR